MAVSQRIKFRCVSCNKPLSIGRRKIGAAVACPKCKAKTVVPETSFESSSDDSEENLLNEFQVYDEDFDEPSLVYADDEISRKTDLHLNDRLSVPRKVVYFQGALLGIVAVAFFLLGLLIGNTTAPRNQSVESEANVSGTVLVAGESGLIGDEGAVVILLPTGEAPNQRFDSVELQPGRTLTGSNPEVPLIRGFGGNICTANRAGNFQMIVDSKKEYILIVISKNGKRTRDLEDKFYSEVGFYFTNPEELVLDQICYYKKIRPARANVRLGEINLSEK